jgi:endonuclease-3
MAKSTARHRAASPRSAKAAKRANASGRRVNDKAAQPAQAARKPAKTSRSPRGKKGRAAPARDRREQAKQVVRLLAKAYPDARCALRHENAYQLLVATILSAQCTDERVNLVTPKLFAKYPDIPALAAASQDDLETIIRSTGFFRAKATSLRGMAQAVVERFAGEIPRTLEDLVTLPGVGRKTANVLLGTVWRIPSGVVVDTHVKRITGLLGLSRAATAEQVEQDLMALVPRDDWIDFSHRLIHHGRRICVARRPNCPVCPLLPACDRVGLPPLK